MDTANRRVRQGAASPQDAAARFAIHFEFENNSTKQLKQLLDYSKYLKNIRLNG
ncbi:hypothetical protein [Azospirillum argentinense]